MLIWGDLFLVFFGLVLYFTKKLYCLVPVGYKGPFLQDVQSQSGDSCRMTVEDLEWGPDVHPEM